MPRARRGRRVHSVKIELLTKSQEAALAAVQTFNNPLITFRSEIFIVLMNIAWTYLLHAYYRTNHVEYRYYTNRGSRRAFEKTKSGAFRYWELEQCLRAPESPIDPDTANNLRFLIGIRHEIEHQMTRRIDDFLSARFQACCLNYNEYIKKLFGEKFGIDKHLSFSLQFSAISRDQAESLTSLEQLPLHIKAFIEGFDDRLSGEEFNNPKFAYRVLFVAKTANRKGQADQVIEFLPADSPQASQINATYALIRERERPKLLPSQVVERMQEEGFPQFKIHHHTELWKDLNAKDPAKGYGVQVARTWYWYESWLDVVRDHCRQHASRYQ